MSTQPRYSLEAGRVIVGPSGLRLVALHRLEVPAAEHPDGCTGAYTIHATEADRFAHQIVDALNTADKAALFDWLVRNLLSESQLSVTPPGAAKPLRDLAS